MNNGVAVINITAPYYGTFPYLVSFEEKGKYALKTQTGSVVISKLDVVLDPEYKNPVEVGENVTFKVQLPKDATGTITFVSRGVSTTKNLVNGSANLTIIGYPVAQQYSPSISYSGDDRYNPASLALNITVVKVKDYILDFNVSDINVGQIEIVNITLPEDATDDVLIFGNFSQRTYSQAINKGFVSFNIADLAAGTYNITVLYQGYNKYESKNLTKTFKVSKVNSTIAIEFVNNTIVVSVPKDATGNVLINIKTTISKNVTIDNGKATLDVSNVYPGPYVVYVNYYGDGKYFANTTSKSIVIPPTNDYLLNVTVEDIIIGENATVIVRLPKDAIGFVNITIDKGNPQKAEVKNGIATLNVPDLKVGDHDVSINFTDAKYRFKSNSTVFTVFKIKTVLSPSVSIENRSVNITVYITDGATGNITIYVDNVPHSCEIIGNKAVLPIELMPGDHSSRVNYAGDENHTDAITSAFIIGIDKISDYELSIDLENLITVIENNTITVTFPEYAKGEVTIYVNGEEFDVTINTNTHKAVLILPWMKEGNYTVYVPYSDSIYDFKEATNNFTVIKLNTTVDVDVDDITKDMSEIINITLNENVTGEMLINVSGTVYYKYLEGGITNLTLSNLEEGVYNVTVMYLGDDFFNENFAVVNFTVYKLTTDIIINASDIIVGHNLDMTITLSSNITDLIIVDVGGTNYTTFAYKGIANLTVSGLAAGDYNITAYYAGDNNYYPATNVTNVTVFSKKSSNITVSVADITVGDNITVNVNTSEPINGPVYVTIAGVAYTETLVDGKVSFNVSDLIARDYHVSAFFMGDDVYDL
ncbi:Ig-like domain-containing protein, partial [Methanobrevibacter millerae]